MQNFVYFKMQYYEVCIVGAGMVGSSASKYIAKHYSTETSKTDPRVCLIGPTEPQNRDGHEIFAAHYDEARITSSTATDNVWAKLARQSINRYRNIESESGIDFYKEIGCLSAGNPLREHFTADTLNSAKEQKFEVTPLENELLCKKFPYINLSKDHTAVLEEVNAGYINPRKLVEAQKRLAAKYGCRIIDDIVRSVTKADEKDMKTHGFTSNQTIMKIETKSKLTVFARKVLLATNAFTEGFAELLPPGVKLNMQPVTQSVLYAEISSDDLHTIENMPSLVLRSIKSIFSSSSEDEYFDCYVLPPVKYPDGKTYIKLGHGKKYDRPLAVVDIPKWYTNPLPSEMSEILKKYFHSVFPGLKPLSYHSDTCVTVDTVTGRPFIDHVTEEVGVAVGDCGSAAKSSDEIGRLAAQLMIRGTWDPDEPLAHEHFRVALKNKI